MDDPIILVTILIIGSFMFGLWIGRQTAPKAFFDNCAFNNSKIITDKGALKMSVNEATINAE